MFMYISFMTASERENTSPSCNLLIFYLFIRILKFQNGITVQQSLSLFRPKITVGTISSIKVVPMKIVHSEVCASSRVTRTLFL